MQTGRRSVTGIVLFLFGLLLAQVVAISAFWPDMEASLFDRSLTFEESLDTVRCPILLTTGEEASISATFTNTTDRATTLTNRMRISQGGVTFIRESQELLELEAGESADREWAVSSEDAAYGMLVLARVATLRRGTRPGMDYACGMLVLPISGIGGQVILVLATAVSLVTLGAGLWLWLRKRQASSTRDRHQIIIMSLLTGLVVVNLLVSLLGWWGMGLLILVVTLILLGSVLERFISPG